MWEIIDINGTIYSGNEDEIQATFDQILDGTIEICWQGDLKLIQIHNIHK